MNEKGIKKGKDGLEKVISMLSQNKKEKALNDIATTMFNYRKTLDEFRGKILESLEEGSECFLVDDFYDIRIANKFFKKIDISVFRNSNTIVYIDKKGLRKLDKELKKYDMEGF